MAADRVEESYRRIHPKLWHALLGYSSDPDLASDAEAEAFSQALRRGRRIRDVDAWVWRSAFRIAAGMLKERRKSIPSSTSTDRPVVDSSVAEFLAELEELSDQQRAIVALRYVGGLTPGEIASVLHTTPGSVRVQLHRAHAHLRRSMENADG